MLTQPALLSTQRCLDRMALNHLKNHRCYPPTSSNFLALRDPKKKPIAFRQDQ